jgi:WD40 repeat protein
VTRIVWGSTWCCLTRVHWHQVALLRKHPYSHTKHCNLRFSLDGEFLFTGGSDGFVYYYDLRRTPEMKESRTARFDPPMYTLGHALKTPAQPSDAGLKHNGPISAVAWHPSLAMFASGCSTLCLWTPPPPT